MHLIFAASGIKHDMEQFEKFMQTATFPMTYTDKDGKEVKAYIQSQLRPMVLYDFVFPKENLDVVLNTLDPKRAVSMTDGKGTKILSKTISMIRRALKLKSIPKSDKKKGEFPLYKKNIRIVGIGVRDDVDFTNKFGATQEAL